MFLDEAEICIAGGNGGNGCVGWRREKYVSKGGPDGGDGGEGGSVFIYADPNTDTLSNFQSQKKFAAENGKMGSGNNSGGKGGNDLQLLVPPGTTITVNGEHFADLTEPHQEVLCAHGGKGGFGNAHFKSSTRQRPDFAEKGEPGESVTVHLELKLVADIGIIGFPNVGKSTLISVISAAKPKIANYPFTTLVPNLGVVHVHDRSYVVCDIPGLIEGAHEGKGLGHEFLKHVERCGTLLHVLDLSRALVDGELDASKLVDDYHVIRAELKKHSPALAVKRELVVLNKTDLTSEELDPFMEQLKKGGIPLWRSISGATRRGTDELAKALLPIVLGDRTSRAEQEERNAPVVPDIPILRPREEKYTMGAFTVTPRDDGSVLVTGKRIEQFTKMTDFSAEGGMLRFRDVVDRIGLRKAINRARKTDDAPVFIGTVRVESYL